MHFRKIATALIVILSISFSAKSQITTSNLAGIVRDEEGKALAGATVTAIFSPANIRYVTTTSATGRYNLTNLRSGGPYVITTTYVGYTPQTQDEVYLQLAENNVVDARLVKATTELNTVTVASAGRNTILNAGRTGAATNIGRAEINRLPSVTRNINDITRVTPQSNGTSVGGGNYRQNNITVDGADFNNNFGIGTNLPAGGAPISLDALDQITVSITPYDVRQSGFIGSALNAVSRSGTNQFQGSIYKYFRSGNEQGQFVGPTKVQRQSFIFQQYGARVGGPIIKNKLFFFGSYETEDRPTILQSRVASDAGNPYVTGSTRVFRPSRDSLNIIKQYLISTYNYDPGDFENYAETNGNTKILGRIDWNINSNHRFNVRYNQVEGGSPNPPSTSRSPLANLSGNRTAPTAAWFRNSNYFQGANFYSAAAELNSRFGKFTNVLRGTYTDQDDSRTTNSDEFPFVDIISNTGGNDLTYTSFGYEPFSKGNIRRVKSVSVIDNVIFPWKKHLFTAGAQADFSKTTNGFQRFATSYYTFNSWADFIGGQKPRDFGITYSLLPGFQQAFPSFKFAQYAAYIQDEMSLTDRFKLTLGLRADLPTYPDVDEIKTHPLIANMNFYLNKKINTGELPKSRVMFSPRVGFNWDVNGDRSMQIRGGAGIFTGKIPFVWVVSQSGDAGLLQVTQAYVGQANTPGPFNPSPSAYLPSVVPAAGSVVPTAGISAMSRDFKFPQSLKISAAIDKRLAKGLIMTVEGIFNKDIYTPFYNNINLVPPTPLNIPGYPDTRMIYPNPNNLKFINPLNAQGVPTPGGTTSFNTYVLENGKKGYYGSLTVKLEKTFSKGFFAMAAYTGSVAANLFDGSGDQPASAWQTTNTVNGSNFAVLAPSSFVVPNRVIASVSYRREYLKHLGTAITLFYEGAPQSGLNNAARFSYIYTADFNRDGNNADLIYIPRDPSEITFVPRAATATNPAYTAQQQSDAFFAYIDQDKYLRKHKGEYAERNGGQFPWRSQLDVKFTQDIFYNLGKNRNTLQFSVDVFNFTNMLNHRWGANKQLSTVSNGNQGILVPTNVAALSPGGATVPTFQLALDNGALPTQTFRTTETTSSTYFMQFGIRYLFN